MAKKKKSHKSYAIDQSVFYRLSSKKKLSSILNVELKVLKELASGEGNYNVFTIEGGKCNLTGKVLKPRTIQNPKVDLKRIQKKIQVYISRISSPDFNHGASINRSYKTNAEHHINSESVATFDITSFFENTKRSKVFSFFYKKMKCSADVADLLANLRLGGHWQLVLLLAQFYLFGLT